MIHSTGGVPVRVRVKPETYDLDVEGIAAAITPKTRAVIVNSPHNPTGRIFPAATIQQLASVLESASEANRRPILWVPRTVAQPLTRAFRTGGPTSPSPSMARAA